MPGLALGDDEPCRVSFHYRPTIMAEIRGL
jgi:hypothetical protein